MSFGHPWLLLTLLAVPAAAALGLHAWRRRRVRYAVRYTNLEVLASVASGRPSWRRTVPPALFLLALAAAGVAVARPSISRLVPVDRATVVLVIDASGSMEATDVKPTRVGAAEEAVRIFLDRVPKRLRVGLIVFAGDAQVAAPPTTDHDLVRRSLAMVENYPGFSGTAIGDALALAVHVAQQSVGNQRMLASASASPPPPRPATDPASILFLSDGSQNRGQLSPEQGAERARAAGIPVYTFALGTPDGVLVRGFGPFRQSIPVPPDPQTLAEIARVTGGKFFEARTAQTLRTAYENLGSRLGRKPGRSEVTFAFLAAAAALLLGAGALSALWAPRLP